MEICTEVGPSSSEQHQIRIGQHFDATNDVTLYHGDCVDLLRSMPKGCVDLVVTSPPYNMGKSYESKVDLGAYVALQMYVISECVRVLKPRGSLCWQVGNFVRGGEIYPLDALLYPHFHNLKLRMRNRIVWHFEHGLHNAKRFSGRYEVIMWFTKGRDYVFNLDEVRVPQKYPGKKHYRGTKAGQYSCNPKGKNPGDVWLIPNVKANHVEKTIHPCQFPVELIERLVLAMTNPGGLVLDPYMGVGTSAIAAILHGRRAAGAEVDKTYLDLAVERVTQASKGVLPIRPKDRPIYEPPANTPLTISPFTQIPREQS